MGILTIKLSAAYNERCTDRGHAWSDNFIRTECCFLTHLLTLGKPLLLGTVRVEVYIEIGYLEDRHAGRLLVRLGWGHGGGGFGDSNRHDYVFDMSIEQDIFNSGLWSLDLCYPALVYLL